VERRYIGAGPIEIRDEAFLDRVFPNAEDDRNNVGCRLRRARRLEPADRRQHGHRACVQSTQPSKFSRRDDTIGSCRPEADCGARIDAEPTAWRR
jgi:hypothetical protein